MEKNEKRRDWFWLLFLGFTLVGFVTTVILTIKGLLWVVSNIF